MPRQRSTVDLPKGKQSVGRQPIPSAHQIDPVWCPGPVPPRFWQHEEHRRDYLLWLAHKLRLRRMEQWYSVTGKSFTRNHGATVLDYYRGSPCEMLRSLFPQYEWCEWRFSRVPHEFWDSLENQWRFLEWLGREMGVRRLEDWYRVTIKDVARHGGDRLLSRYGYCLLPIMSSLYPEHDWKPWLYTRVPVGFWRNRGNRRSYMRWLGEQLGFRKAEDWYRVTYRDFQEHGGNKPLARRSIATAVADAFPGYPWELRRFKHIVESPDTVHTPKGFWTVRANRLRYLRCLGRRLGFRQPADWYRVSVADFKRHKGAQCLSYYRCCPALAAMDLHPKYPWMEWLFPRVPTGFWARPENRRRYVRWLGEQLGFQRPEDWCRMRQRDFARNHGGGLLRLYRSMGDLRRDLLPDLD